MFSERILLAPLTKGGNLPFRRLCVDFGARVTCSEMVYASQLARGSGKEKALIRHHSSETFFGVQLAARKPEVALKAARMAVEAGARFVDLNCGCPIHDTMKRGMGARLMSKPRKLQNLVKTLAENLSVPVSVKIRTGVKEGRTNFLEIGRMVEDAGARALIIHGRTQEQRYTKAADWEAIGRAQSELGIPVYGNGDVLTHYEAEARLKQSGASGAVLARGALIKPWLFQEIAEGRELLLSGAQRMEIYHRLCGYFREHFGDDEIGRKRSLYFLSWHFSFFSRYRHLPPEEWSEASSQHPLLQTRLPRPEGDLLEERLASSDKEWHQRLAEILWQSQTHEEACRSVIQATD